MGAFALSPPPMIILGDTLMTASPMEPMEHTVSVRKRCGQGGDEPKPATEVGQGNRDEGQPIWETAEVFFQHALPTTDEEGISGHDQGHVSVPTAPRSHFIVIQAQLRLGVLKAAFDGPTGAGRPGQFSQGDGRRRERQIGRQGPFRQGTADQEIALAAR